MPTSEDLARRFLHVNLNCASVQATEKLYGGVLGLTTRMRTDPQVPGDGSIMGLDGPTYTETAFLYDGRGGRRSCALEAIEWSTPPLRRDTNTDPVRPGIRSTLLSVTDLAAISTDLRAAGVRVSDPIDGLISGTESVLALDPDGAVIELTQSPPDADPHPGALFGGIRIAAIDAAATVAFLTEIGFAVIDGPTRVSVAGEQLAPGGTAEPVDCVVARLGLPEDGAQFTLTVVEHPDTARHPRADGGNSQGLYRCALRVNNVERALALLPDWVGVQGDPVWCPLPGTKIDGLYIAFLRSPDGVLFEFVERPLSFFAPTPSR
ncbi:VOC family protein [Mycobacterium intracellulare]|uniref:VOC family protein n=1 Tax=Mycobacterium intracellulare TaxID=1767 RepID=UPI001CD9C6F5|nr:VOC family protein [Mycobacterium intracellulare]MCA2247641.1 VOC family protein [Mycobacterium intracellulare]